MGKHDEDKLRCLKMSMAFIFVWRTVFTLDTQKKTERRALETKLKELNGLRMGSVKKSDENKPF